MHIHYIQHAPFEKLGVIEDWAHRQGYQLSGTQTYNGETLPLVATFDFLVIMGGPQSPSQLEQYPYIRAEIELAKQAITQQKPVLGVCLGAQIIAESLGAKTTQSPNKEIGVYPVELTKEGEQDPLFKLFSRQFNVMHWHNDMPGIPNDAVLLAHSAGCPRQAFRYGDRVYGLQFHLEMTAECIEGMIAYCAEDLQPGRYVQTKEELLTADHAPINQKMCMTLDYLAERMS